MPVNNSGYFELIDEELVALAQQANKDSIKELYRRYKNRMLCYCNHFLYNKDEAEDVTQDIFIKTFNSINTFRQDSSFATWIYKIAKNTCLNKNGSLAVRMRNLFVSTDKPIEQGTNLYDILRSDIDDPRKVLELKEIKILLNKAIDELSDKKKSYLSALYRRFFL